MEHHLPMSLSGGSLFQSLYLRQIRPNQVLQRPYIGEWTSDGEAIGSGVLMVLNDGLYAPPLALSFAKKRGNGHMLAVADEEGFVSIFDTNRQLPSMLECHTKTRDVRKELWLAHSNAIFDICWIKDDTHILTASGDQTIRLWDVEHRAGVGTMVGHSGSVKSTCAHPSQSDLFVSVSRDGCVAFWDIRNPTGTHTSTDEPKYSPAAKIKDAHKGFNVKSHRRKGYTRSVTSVLYLKDERVVATAGANDGVVKFWDTRKLKIPIAHTPPERYENCVPGISEGAQNPLKGSRRHGIAGLSQDPTGTRLIATCVDSRIYMHDITQPGRGELKTFSGHMMGSFYIKASFSPDGSHILSGSTDGNAHLWKVDGPEDQPHILRGHSGEVTAVDWCPTELCKVATCSDDYTVRVWNMKEPRFAKQSTFRSSSRSSISAIPCSPPNTSKQFLRHDLAAGMSDAQGSEVDLLEVSGDISETVAINIGLQRDQSDKEATPPSKRSRGLNCPTEDLHQVGNVDQESPLGRLPISPSSTLSPPNSCPRRRKTIMDYFGLQPEISKFEAQTSCGVQETI